MYDALAPGHAVALTLDDFGLLSLPRPAQKKHASPKPKASPVRPQRVVSAIRKLPKPR